MPTKGRRQPLTKRQRKLVRARASGASLAEAARRAGYRCRSQASAEATARKTLRRLTGRPQMRRALADLGMDLHWAAKALRELAEAPTITDVFDGKGNLLRRIVRHDGRWRWHVVRIVLEAFEALAPAEQAGPWDGLSDEDLAAIAGTAAPNDAGTIARKALPPAAKAGPSAGRHARAIAAG